MESVSSMKFLIFVCILLQYAEHNVCLAADLNPTAEETTFIQASCKATIYPSLCFNSLSIYANKIRTSPKVLAFTAIYVSFQASKSSSAAITKLSKIHGLKAREIAAAVDCVEEVGDSVYELKKSVDEMGHLGKFNFELGISNIQTWVSAALTDEDTCMEGFEGDTTDGHVKVVVRREIVGVAQLISNALALINRFASSHQ